MKFVIAFWKLSDELATIKLWVMTRISSFSYWKLIVIFFTYNPPSEGGRGMCHNKKSAALVCFLYKASIWPSLLHLRHTYCKSSSWSAESVFSSSKTSGTPCATDSALQHIENQWVWRKWRSESMLISIDNFWLFKQIIHCYLTRNIILFIV